MSSPRPFDFRALPAGVPSTLRIDVCTITPDDALEFLESMPECQRPLKTGYLRTITAQLARGEFPFTHAPIVFDTNGQMIDGQQRSYKMALMIKAWNAFLCGKPVRVLRIREEENFPQPL